MKRMMLLAGLVIMLAGMAWGQVAAPATQPGVSPATAKIISERKATNAQRVAENPEYMAIVNKVPKNLIPTKPDSGPELQSRIKALRAWGIANLDGKPVRIEAFVENDQRNAEFYLAGDPMTQFEIYPNGQRLLGAFQPGDKVIIEGVAGKGGALLITATAWSAGEMFRKYNLLVLDAKVTKAAPAATSPSSQPK